MKKILVIDDNKDIRENTAEILALAGYDVITAANGKLGVERALQEKPHLIVCDIMMPDLDGWGVLHLLRRNPATQATPFIFLTAKTERSDFRRGMEMGADDYLTKPFDDVELLGAIESRLKKLAALETNYSSSPEGLQQFLKDIHGTGILEGLATQYSTEGYSKKETVYEKGRRPRFLFYIMKGKVKGFRLHEDGKEYITNLYGEGDFLGYTALLEDAIYEETAAAIEDTELLAIPKEDFLKMVYTDINVASKFIRIITQNLNEKEERLLSLAYGSLRKRIARALVEVVEKFKPGKEATPLEISREDLAQYVGTATESLIRTLSDFKAEKKIEIRNGKIIVKDLDQLKHLAF